MSRRSKPTPEPEVAAPTEAPAPEVSPTEAPATEEPAVEAPPTKEPAEEPQTVTVESEIVGIQWHWQAYQDTAELNDITVPDADDYKILFNADGTANIQVDCNVIGGSYTLNGASLSISLGPSTMAFCGEESLDQFYLASLEAAAGYVINEGELLLNLMADAGNMVFDRGPLDITPEQISLDAQGLPFPWQAVTVPTSPYDESQPPGPKGLPEHIEILFGLTDPADWNPSFPIMYIMPVNAYRETWDDNGNGSVTATVEQIQASQNYRVLTDGDNLRLVLPAEGDTLTLVDLASYESTVDPPDPEPGEPTATVISPVGTNVRTGPGTMYPIMGIAPQGTDGRVVGGIRTWRAKQHRLGGQFHGLC